PVVVAVGQADPPLVLLAGDVRLGGLALRVEGVERLLEALLGGLPGVDGAPDRRDRRAPLAHRVPSLHRPDGGVTPKNAQPFQCPPVTLLAMALSVRYTSPSNSKPL